MSAQQQVTGDRRLRRETLATAGIAAAASAMAVHQEWCERLCRWLMRYEAYEADEAVLAVFLFALLFGALLLRRQAQLRGELRLRDAAEREAHWAARHDWLTGLPNRRAFAERFGPGRVADIAIVLIDLDGFKAINDSNGHAIGDEILKAVAARLERVIARHPGGMVARMGGDEYCCLLRPAPADPDLLALGGQIVDALGLPIPAGTAELCVTAAVGIARADAEAPDHDRLLHCADQAMYRAKRSGRGRVVLFGNPGGDTASGQ
jgi:diguanylate cyclase (GGDEF)-like protein